MELGAIFLWLSIVPVIMGIGFSIKFYRTNKKKYKKYAKDSSYLTILLLAISFLIFVYYCMTANPDIFYSYYYTVPSLEWYYKFSAVWAGRTGSVFLWLFLIVVSLGITEYFFSKKDLESRKLNDYARPITLTVIFLFIIILLNSRPFIDTVTELLAKAAANPEIPSDISGSMLKSSGPRGQGMNAQLISPWMAIHPPILFIGYASFTIPLSASFVYTLTGKKDWPKLTEPWSRFGWLFLTLGIAIGAVWAYVTLGWGGYWAWDPVENASLLPWITGTAFLHLQLRYKKTKEYKYLSHIFVFITFSLIIFATLTTRGGITVGGTHAYPGTLPILKNMTYWVLMGAPLAIGGFFLWQRYKEDKEKNHD